jgi:hypothetical protein
VEAQGGQTELYEQQGQQPHEERRICLGDANQVRANLLAELGEDPRQCDGLVKQGVVGAVLLTGTQVRRPHALSSYWTITLRTSSCGWTPFSALKAASFSARGPSRKPFAIGRRVARAVHYRASDPIANRLQLVREPYELTRQLHQIAHADVPPGAARLIRRFG